MQTEQPALLGSDAWCAPSLLAIYWSLFTQLAVLLAGCSELGMAAAGRSKMHPSRDSAIGVTGHLGFVCLHGCYKQHHKTDLSEKINLDYCT